MSETIVIKLGGSIFFPNIINTKFINAFKKVIMKYEKYNFVIIVGGGNIARQYQKALKDCGVTDNLSLNMIGIDTTKINAHMFSRIFENAQILKNLEDKVIGRITISPGFEPGHSTDYDAVYLANKFSNKVIILSNISKIYTSDPKTDPNAKPIDHISWSNLQTMVGKEFSPGASMPIDPVAVRTGMANGTKVIFADGKDLDNFENILNNKGFVGSSVS